MNSSAETRERPPLSDVLPALAAATKNLEEILGVISSHRDLTEGGEKFDGQKAHLWVLNEAEMGLAEISMDLHRLTGYVHLMLGVVPQELSAILANRMSEDEE